MENFIKAKRQAFKAWKTGYGTRAEYHADKHIARRAVHHARHEIDKVVFGNIYPKSSEVFHLENQMGRENVNVVGDKLVKKDAGEMFMSKEAKQKVWLEHYASLPNMELNWDPEHPSD